MTPILYSEHLCPHCIRSRLALLYAELPFELRDVEPAQLPAQVRDESQGRLPVLQIVSGEHLRASGDILHWALLKHDPDGLMDYEVDVLDAMHDLVRMNDGSFANDIDRYVGGVGDRDAAWADCALFLDGLEARLERSRYLFADRESFADVALFPFVLRLVEAEPERFSGPAYSRLRRWREDFANRTLFRAAMRPVPRWQAGQAPLLVTAQVAG